jgi:hypothetical protein
MAGESVSPASEILKRIYHEDDLLAQRTAYFITANAFLSVAFAALLVAKPPAGVNVLPGELAIIGLALFLAYFSLAFGRRHAIAIDFWRQVEKAHPESFSDSVQRDFYRTGWAAVTGAGSMWVISAVPHKSQTASAVRGSMYGSAPWRLGFVGSTNNAIGVLVPTAIAVYWVLVSIAIPSPDGSGIPVIPLALVVVTGSFFGWMWAHRPWAQFAVVGSVEFRQIGLPPETEWGLTVDPQSIKVSTKARGPQQIVCHLPCGLHRYTIEGVSGYTAAQASGSVDVTEGGAKVEVEFVPGGPQPSPPVPAR